MKRLAYRILGISELWVYDHSGIATPRMASRSVPRLLDEAAAYARLGHYCIVFGPDATGIAHTMRDGKVYPLA